jgi:hypothetical protein
MKFVILLLILMLTVPPVQASGCAHDHGSAGEAPMEHPMDHSQAGQHDCCETDESEGSSECPEMDDCSSCLSATGSAPAIPVTGARVVPACMAQVDLNGPGLLSPSHSMLPFRPPIA